MIKEKYNLLSNSIHVDLHKKVDMLLPSYFLIEIDYVTRETKNKHSI